MATQDFPTRVLRHIPRATRREKENIRRELEDHMEDHTLALQEKGLPQEEAKSEAEAAMGDPAEVGRALNEQLSVFWLWLGRACRGLALVLLAVALSVGYRGYQGSARRFRESVQRDPMNLPRMYTSNDPAGDLKEQGYTAAWSVDIRLGVGEDVIRLYEVRMDPTPGRCRAAVRGLVYNRDSAWPAADLLGEARLTSQWGDPGGEEADAMRYSLQGITGRDFVGVPVSPGDDHLTLSGEHLGQEWSVEIPLNWEEVSP